MMTIYNSSDKLAVRDSLDDDDLSDVDDDVFIRDGKNGSKMVEDRGLKRPLMHPRRKTTKESFRQSAKRCRTKRLFWLTAIFFAFIVCGFLFYNMYVLLSPKTIIQFKSWLRATSKLNTFYNDDFVRPCTSLRVTNVWEAHLPKLTSEAPINAVDVNNDGVKDLIIGYRTENGPVPFPFLCPIFFPGHSACQGGIIALDGKNGKPLWQQWLAHAVYHLECSSDFTDDQINDCVVFGRNGLLSAVNCQNGSIIWSYYAETQRNVPLLNWFWGQTILDVDKDGVNDILVSHTLQQDITNKRGEIILISGKHGTKIAATPTPNVTESYYPPQLFLRRMNNTNTSEVNISLIFGTGDETRPGALYLLSLSDLVKRTKNNSRPVEPTLLYRDAHKGILHRAIITDLNNDSYDDLVISTFSGSVVALDGTNFAQLWNHTHKNAEITTPILSTYYNNDDVLDFLITFHVGAGFPAYYYTEVVILDGRNGNQINERAIRGSSASTSVMGSTVNMNGKGLNMFLYWMAYCKGYEDSVLEFQSYGFLAEYTIWEQSRANICKLRFNTTVVLKLYALNQYILPPGILLYTSDDHKPDFNNTYDTLDEVKTFLKDHPDFEFSTFVNRPFDKESKESKIKDGMFDSRYPEWPNRPQLDWMNDQYGPEQDPNEDEYEEMDPRKTSEFPYFRHGDDKSGKDVLKRNAGGEDLVQEPIQTPILGPRQGPGPDFVQNSVQDDEAHIKDPSLPAELNDLDEYNNIVNAKNRLLHDLNFMPSDILRETYVDTAEKRLFGTGRNKLEQRDLRFKKKDRSSVKKELESMYNKRRKETLWDLESEKEQYEREHGYIRGKREATSADGIPKIDSAGVLLRPLTESMNLSTNSIDFVFATYYLPDVSKATVVLPNDRRCVADKMELAKSPTSKYHNLEKTTNEDLFTKMCLEERGVRLVDVQQTGIPKLQTSVFRDDILQLSFSTLTVRRINLQCDCGPLLQHESCGIIQPP